MSNHSLEGEWLGREVVCAAWRDVGREMIWRWGSYFGGILRNELATEKFLPACWLGRVGNLLQRWKLLLLALHGLFHLSLCSLCVITATSFSRSDFFPAKQLSCAREKMSETFQDLSMSKRKTANTVGKKGGEVGEFARRKTLTVCTRFQGSSKIVACDCLCLVKVAFLSGHACNLFSFFYHSLVCLLLTLTDFSFMPWDSLVLLPPTLSSYLSLSLFIKCINFLYSFLFPHLALRSALALFLAPIISIFLPFPPSPTSSSCCSSLNKITDHFLQVKIQVLGKSVKNYLHVVMP